MPEQHLDGADVVVGLQKVSGKAVPKRVCCDFFRNIRPSDGKIERFLKLGFMEMIAPSFVGCRHNRQCLLWEKPLVDELWGRGTPIRTSHITDKHHLAGEEWVQMLCEKLRLESVDDTRTWTVEETTVNVGYPFYPL